MFAERTLHSIIKLTVYQFCSDSVRSFFIVKFEGCKIANILKTCNLAIFVSLDSDMRAVSTILRHFKQFLKYLSNIANALPSATFLLAKFNLRNETTLIFPTTASAAGNAAIHPPIQHSIFQLFCGSKNDISANEIVA